MKAKFLEVFLVNIKFSGAIRLLSCIGIKLFKVRVNSTLKIWIWLHLLGKSCEFIYLQQIADREDVGLLTHRAIISMIVQRREVFGKFWLGVESIFHICLTLVTTLAPFIGFYTSYDYGSTENILWCFFLILSQVLLLIRLANVSTYVWFITW